MDLRNGKIALKEILANPEAKALLTKEFPHLMKHPMMRMARNMPLQKILQYAEDVVPKEKLRRIIAELEKLSS